MPRASARAITSSSSTWIGRGKEGEGDEIEADTNLKERGKIRQNERGKSGERWMEEKREGERMG